MSLAYKFYDSVIGEIVNKTRLSGKKLARSNQNSRNNKYLYMTEESGEKIKDFIDLDNKRHDQIIQDAEVLKKAYLSDEVVEKITSEIDKIFEKEYYSYTNRLHEYKTVLENYRNYLDGIEDRVRDYEKMALKSNTELQQFSVAFEQYHDELESYSDSLNRYEEKLSSYKLQNDTDKEIINQVGAMLDKNMDLDVAIRNEVHNELGNFKMKIQDYMEDEFTKIAARSIKSKRKMDAMFGFLVATNLITIAGIVALYIFR
ncbi:MAG: hypothetical protein E7262_08135 [Lachnospiraceae bacterium]|nr:hypothetical protein [Lachnospiraceae bacterium]